MAAALVVRAVALQEAVAFLDNAVGKDFPSHPADVDIGDLPVILPDAARSRSCHILRGPLANKERDEVVVAPLGGSVRQFQRGSTSNSWRSRGCPSRGPRCAHRRRDR